MSGKKTLVEYVFSTYPSETQKDFREFCEKHSHEILTWKDFALKLAEFVHEKDIKVGMSSTWAVCQEFLGNLSGEDLAYSRGRGGLWSMTDYLPISLVSVRDVLIDLQEKYPC
jgi:hypothetical protein